MLRTLWTSKAGMNANQERLDVISNNLVNSTTTGYKKVEVGFKDLLSQSLDRKGLPLNDKDSVIGTGSKISEWYRDTKQGNLLDTALTTDLAIEGDGYFKVISQDGGEYYTRDGNFNIDSLGRLVDTRGNKVEIKYSNGFSDRNVNFTKNNILVDTNGQVFVKNTDTFTKVGDLAIYTAIGDRSFLAAGDNLYKPVPGVEVTEAAGYNIHQGMLEGSNVDIATEFSDMIVTQRAFELSAKGITTADEMWGMINNLKR
ncbi:flagellar hook-basal body complex protein [Clostridium sp.]|uniref:flagellar hook-basal body complex protein n=1 Tax=Clostridium sp. TaxID=1506 RepID=UPI002601ABCA|nr:flagellar hook-basal body complex protein [Clostridium sp.]